jgi:hypothetical protein
MGDGRNGDGGTGEEERDRRIGAGVERVEAAAASAAARLAALSVLVGLYGFFF